MLCNVYCFVNGHPSYIHCDSDKSQHFYADTVGGKDVEYDYGSVSIPVESVRNFEAYPGIPAIELNRYFAALLRQIYEKASQTGSFLDITELQSETLTLYWNKWLKKRFVTLDDPKPLLLQLSRQVKKKSLWE